MIDTKTKKKVKLETCLVDKSWMLIRLFLVFLLVILGVQYLCTTFILGIETESEN